MGQLDLGGQVLDKELISSDGRRLGKVDDLLLDLKEGPASKEGPEVKAIVTGPTALARYWPSWVQFLVCRVYALLGVKDAQPTIIDWSHVTIIQAVVHLNITREQKDSPLSRAIERRFIRRLPRS